MENGKSLYKKGKPIKMVYPFILKDKINLKFFLTSKCNWNCEYCFRTDFNIKYDSETNNRILKYIPIISKMTDDIMLTGGEIGLIDPDILEFIFHTFKNFISLCC